MPELKQILRDRKLSQAKLARETRINASQLSQYVNGSRPSYQTAFKIAEALELQVADIWPHDKLKDYHLVD